MIVWIFLSFTFHGFQLFTGCFCFDQFRFLGFFIFQLDGHPFLFADHFEEISFGLRITSFFLFVVGQDDSILVDLGGNFDYLKINELNIVANLPHNIMRIVIVALIEIDFLLGLLELFLLILKFLVIS